MAKFATRFFTDLYSKGEVAGLLPEPIQFPTHLPIRIMKTSRILNRRLSCLAVAAIGLAALNTHAASGNKKDTGTMNIGTTDWSAAMGTGDTGTFDNSQFAITPAHLAAMDLGSANISILALVFKNNLQGPWTIGSSGGYALQLNQNSVLYRGGASPNTSLDLSQTGGTMQSGIFTCPLVIGGNPGPNNQQFNVVAAASLTFNNNLTNGANTLTLAGAGSYSFNSNIVSTAATAGLTMNGTGTASFTTPNTYAGLLTLNSGTFSLAGASGAINTTNIFFNGGKLVLDNSVVNNNNRLPANAMSGVGNGSELVLLGNGGANTAEAMNTLAISNSTAIITVSQPNPSQTTVLAAGAFARSVNGTVLVRGDNLGWQAGQAQITLANTGGLALVGSTLLNGAPTSDATTTLKVVPYMIGDITSTGNGSSLVTYDTSFGLRPLNTASEFTPLSAGYTSPGLVENVLGTTVTLANNVTNNSILFNAGGTVDGSGTGLAVDSGLVAAVGGGTAAINNTITNLILGNGTWNEGELFATVGNTLNVNAPITVTGNGGLTKGGAGNVTCASSNTYSGMTSVNGGTLTLGTGDGNGNLPGTNVWIAPSATLTLNLPNSTNLIHGWVGGGGILKNNSASSTLVLNQPAGSYLIKDLNGTNGSTIVLGGAASSTNTLPSAGTNPGLGGNSPGMTLDFTSGNWLFTGDNNGLKFNFVIEGTANIVNLGRNFSFAQNGQTFAMHGGSLTLSNQYGFRWGQGANLTFTGTQDGGTITSHAQDQFLIGGNNANTVATYTMSGGAINILSDAGNGLGISAAAAGAPGISTFTMTNNAKVYTAKVISGTQAAPAQQVFNFAGGTLAAIEVNAGKLAGPAAPATQGYFYNNGGMLAPGDIGTPGKTIIDGNFVMNSGTLAIDIGGTTQANAFTNAANNYDFVSVVQVSGALGNATLGGLLTANLINNYTPAATSAFTILTAATSIIGGGTNIGYSGYVPVTSNNVPLPGMYFQAVVIGKNLMLTNYGAALPPLVAAFTPTNTAGTPPLPVNFTDLSTGAITNRHWKFGDGATLDTTSTSVSHTFTNLGIYQVVLTVRGLDGSSVNATGKVSVVNPGGTLTWTGARSSVWDTTTTNWVDALATPYLYADGDGVVFDDTSAITNVTLNRIAGPNAVNLNNSARAYTISGSGGIGGGSTLSVNNFGGTATLLTANTYGGATTIASGATLQLGNGTTSGSIDNTASLDDEGLLVVNTPDNHTINSPVNGAGSLTKAGAGTFGMPNGTLYGNVIVNGGKFSTADYTNIPSVSTLAVSQGGVFEFTAGPSSWFHTIALGPGGGGINHAAAVDDSYGALTGTGPFIKGGAGTMTMNQANNYTGGTVINGGTLVVNDPATMGATGPLTMGVGTVLNYFSSANMTNGPVDASGATINNRNAGTTLMLVQSAGNHGLGGIGGVSGATMIFAGDPNAATTITGAGGGLGVAGMTAIFTGGTWFNGASGAQPVNVEIDGGSLVLPPGSIDSRWLVAGQTLTIHGGSLVSSNAYGIRLANTYGANQGSPGTGPFTGVQDGGLVLSASGDGLQWGSTAVTSFTYDLSGGTVQLLPSAGPLNLGGDLSGAGTTVFTLSGTGKVLAGSSVQGANGSPAQQVFAFNGGTLAAAKFDTTFLQPGLGVPYGTLVNHGGTLAPGDIGTAGQTIITGNYAVDNSDAVLDIDLGGIAKANAFQNTSSYDTVAISGNATLGGSVNLREINGFEPIVGQNGSLTILTAANITGAFANVASGSRLVVSNYPSRSFRVTVSSTNVVLDQYQTPTPQAYFTYSPNSGVAPLVVTFTNLSNGAGLTNLWVFGDGSTSASTAATVSHTYTAAGTNTVSLTVGNVLGANTYTVTNAIAVTASTWVPPHLGTISVSGSLANLAGTGGVSGATYYVLSSTNLSLPRASWTPTYTNTFAPDGSFNASFPVNPTIPAQFFLLSGQP